MTENLIRIEDIREAVRVLRAINHDLRQDILHLLDTKQRKMTVTDIYEHFKIEQSVCSGHLAILRENGIIAVERAGKIRYYTIVRARLKKINEYAQALAAPNVEHGPLTSLLK